MDTQDLVHQIHKAKRNTYSSMIKCTKKVHWEDFLASLDDRSVWTAHRYVTGEPTDGGRTHMPTLRVMQADGSIQDVETNTDKSKMLCDTLFLKPIAEDASEASGEFLAPKFKYKPITNSQIKQAIA